MMPQLWFDSYYLTIFLLMATPAENKGCEKVYNVKAVQNSAVTLTCPLTPGLEVTDVFWEVLQGDIKEKVVSGSNCSSSCKHTNNNKDKQPLCKVRIMQDVKKGIGSLIISPVEMTDTAWYQCSVGNSTSSNCLTKVKITVKDEIQLQTEMRECKTIGPFTALLNSTVMLQCPEDISQLDEPIWGSIEDHSIIPITRCPSHCIFSGSQKPLCERTKTMENGSLVISPVQFTDSHWFLCAVANSTLCYQFRLNVKDKSDSPATQSPEKQRNNDTEVRPNMIVIITSCVCGRAGWSVHVLQKTKKKSTNGDSELENNYENVKEIIQNNDFQYDLIQLQTENTHTFE